MPMSQEQVWYIFDVERGAWRLEEPEHIRCIARVWMLCIT